MPVLIYAENSEGKFSKSILEAVNYGKKVAEIAGTEAIAVTIGDVTGEELILLGNYGVSKVIHIKNDILKSFDSQVYTNILAKVAEAENADVLVFANNYSCRSVAPRLAVRLKAGLITGVIELPTIEGDKFKIKRTAYSGKAFAYCIIESAVKILTLQPNAFPSERSDNTATIDEQTVEVQAGDFAIDVKEVTKATDKVPLTEASVIVSGGRGLKGPENWGMLEELAEELGAALACSKPVADMDWRSHGEHVGQTGITVRPNLYIAIGISGAIQHLAGVNGSRYMVAINIDPEAPFFKAADYGIVGDAFEVVPKLTKAIQDLKSVSAS